MRRRVRFFAMSIAAVLAFAFTGTLAASSSGDATAAADCSREAARDLVEQLHLGNAGDPTVSDPVGQVLCGAFTGPGSDAMVVSLAIPSCGRTAGWVVFQLAGGAWKFVMQRNNGADLAAVCTDIQETQFVLRPGDPHCFPTGGTRSRTWHWDGTRFTASAWKQTTPGSARPESAIVFAPPPARISCQMTDDGSVRGSWVYCWIGRDRGRTPHVKMGPGGRLDRTVKQTLPQGLGGPSTALGKRVTVGRFRCRPQRRGMRCTVVKSGKGFRFNRDGAKRVGP
jgi:hypothetical protein